MQRNGWYASDTLQVRINTFMRKGGSLGHNILFFASPFKTREDFAPSFYVRHGCRYLTAMGPGQIPGGHRS